MAREVAGSQDRRVDGATHDVARRTGGPLTSPLDPASTSCSAGGPGARGPGALSGLRVVDLSRVVGGPWCTKLLGDHGAEVIKVEPPGGDETRRWGPPWQPGAPGSEPTSAYYHGINANKRGIALDLGRERGREVLRRLLESADVLVENFKSGTLERWGLGYEQHLAQRFPRLVHCNISGFGDDGPLGGLPGYDAIAQAMSGLLSVNGSPTSGPVRIGAPVVDMVCGLHALFGIMAALYERTLSGRGQRVQATLYDAGLSLVHPHAANYLADGTLPTLHGNGHPSIVPYDLFPTRTAPVFLAVGNDGLFRRLCELLGRGDLAGDPRFATNTSRMVHREALTGLLREALAEEDGEALGRRLLAGGVPAGAVRSIDAALHDPHTHHREMVATLEGRPAPGSVSKLSRSTAGPSRPPPGFGQHTRELLAELGYAPEAIDALIADGAALERL